MDKNISCRIGIDLGGTKIEGIAMDTEGHELIRHRIDTPSGESSDRYSKIVQSVDMLVKHIESAIGMSGSVGVGIPGTLSVSTGRIKNANTTEMIGKQLDKDLEKIMKFHLFQLYIVCNAYFINTC